ncbi:uncharacterized protein LOC107025477 isoform X1 [Solanum pennellii]|uniref:Uncharacterized protein LOC107025477 isoform X1 n=1 Tax=Solanum pennellii TaxID=28526 RepID=A0ABM1VEH7_SOLPN|nr:uncharacterized protein LOC107025477 isoform X1 [Solanum pennellii]
MPSLSHHLFSYLLSSLFSQRQEKLPETSESNSSSGEVRKAALSSCLSLPLLSVLTSLLLCLLFSIAGNARASCQAAANPRNSTEQPLMKTTTIRNRNRRKIKVRCRYKWTFELTNQSRIYPDVEHSSGLGRPSCIRGRLPIIF